MVPRSKWKPPPDPTLRSELLEGDSATIGERVERYRFLREELGPPAGMLFWGGLPAMIAFHELQRSFVEGNLIATVVMSQTFIEHSLGASFSMSGEDSVVKSGFANLTRTSHDRDHISADVAGALDELRRMRNAYSHPQPGFTARSYMARLKEYGYDPEELAVRDARRAIEIVADYLRDQSPNWTPENQDD